MLATAVLNQQVGGGGGGSFPVVESFSTTSSDAAASSFTIDKPSGTVSGDILLLSVAFGGTSSAAVTLLSGWTRLSPDTNRVDHCLFKVAGGSEPASYTFDYTVTTGRHAVVLHRISGGNGDVEAGFTGSLDVGDLTPSWGSANTLWVTQLRRRSAIDIAIATPPTGFTHSAYLASNAGTTGAAMDVAWKEEATATITPDTWVAATGTNQRTGMIAVRPA